MYKDRDKQRQANKEAQARYKAKAKGITEKVLPKQGITTKVLPDGMMDIETLAMVDAGCGDKLSHGLKRGLDIQCFEDLPPDVQQTIHRLSTIDGKIDQAEKDKRTARVIQYQHLFPDSYNDTSIASLLVQAGPVPVRVSKPGDADYVPMCETTERYRNG